MKVVGYASLTAGHVGPGMGPTSGPVGPGLVLSISAEVLRELEEQRSVCILYCT